MEATGTVAEPAMAEPTNAEVEANLRGTEPVPEVAPQETVAAPPAFDQAAIEKMLQGLLDKKLNPIQSELGQFRKQQRESLTPKPTPPSSWSELTPEQQKATRELIKHAWMEDFGQDWQEQQTWRQEELSFRQQRGIHNLAEQFAGSDFKELDPILGRMYQEYNQKAEAGDDEARVMLQEFETTRAGVRVFVDMAKAELAKQKAEKSGAAQAVQAGKTKSITTTIGNSVPTPTAKGGVFDEKPRTPAEVKAWLAKAETEMRGNGEL